MKTVTLQRWASSGKATFGRLIVAGHSWLTVERSPTDITHPCIPAGTYDLRLGTYFGGDGPGGKEDYPAYEVLGVPGRSLIKIHGANRASELRGCISPGQTLEIFSGEIGITSSREALAQFMAIMGGEKDAQIVIAEIP